MFCGKTLRWIPKRETKITDINFIISMYILYLQISEHEWSRDNTDPEWSICQRHSQASQISHSISNHVGTSLKSFRTIFNLRGSLRAGELSIITCLRHLMFTFKFCK